MRGNLTKVLRYKNTQRKEDTAADRYGVEDSEKSIAIRGRRRRRARAMANHRALIAAILVFCLCFVQVVRCDVGSAAVSAPSSPEHVQELQMLRSKVASLEDEISGRKEETLQLENVVREKSAQIAALVSELELLQVPIVADDESAMKANAHNEMLEKHIVRLGSDLEDQVKKGESLESRASEAEKKLLELTRKLNHAEKINMEQKQTIEELNHRLQQVQDKLSEVKREAKLKAELTKVHGMWLPHWVVVRFVYCQGLASDKWQLHGKPVLDALMQKVVSFYYCFINYSSTVSKCNSLLIVSTGQVSENLAHAQRLVEPHVQTTQNKLVLAAKAHLNSLKNITDVYASAIATRSTQAYRVFRGTIQPSMAKAQEFAGHYWQVSKKFTTPYITKIVATSEPHLSRVGAVLEPYMRPVISAWRKLVMSASVPHRQVQKGVKHFINDNGLLTSDSADRLAWFTASALVALPMFYTYKMLSAAIWRKAVAAQGSGRTRTKASNYRRTQSVDS